MVDTSNVSGDKLVVSEHAGSLRGGWYGCVHCLHQKLNGNDSLHGEAQNRVIKVVWVIIADVKCVENEMIA